MKWEPSELKSIFMAGQKANGTHAHRNFMVEAIGQQMACNEQKHNLTQQWKGFCKFVDEVQKL